MDCGDGDRDPGVCWFCSKGRHGECMREIMVEGRSDGPHDCSFDAAATPCRCGH